MGMAELTHSKRWKTSMNYLYSIGASVVLMGALFKLQHWPGGGAMLTLGMTTEALIFFFSAFEPVMEIPDWAKVYPQLKEDFEGEFAVATTATPSKTNNAMESLFDKADISPELLNKVKKGLQDLSNSASGIAEITSATVATEEYAKNMSSASEAMSHFNEVNNKATHSIEKSTHELVNNYNQSSQILGDSSKELAKTFSESSKRINEQLSATGEKLAVSYKSFTDSISKDFTSLNEQSRTFNTGLSQINTSLSAVNSSYELHLQNTKRLSEASSKAFEDYAKMTELVNGTLEEGHKYQKHTAQLNKNLEALNHVYGNMLGAMNVKG